MPTQTPLWLPSSGLTFLPASKVSGRKDGHLLRSGTYTCASDWGLGENKVEMSCIYLKIREWSWTGLKQGNLPSNSIGVWSGTTSPHIEGQWYRSLTKTDKHFPKFSVRKSSIISSHLPAGRNMRRNQNILLQCGGKTRNKRKSSRPIFQTFQKFWQIL